jgi:beta-phosphoglucomutase-like phosphatase (HAD superfamily)
MKLAIFDIDGTLTNTNRLDDECFVEALAEARQAAERPLAADPAIACRPSRSLAT